METHLNRLKHRPHMKKETKKNLQVYARKEN